jgi:predicted glutamine amidotransferase
MCRLFGLHAGADPVRATFWLLDAPDSLAAQSHRNPDGAGIGIFDETGTAVVDKQPIAAWDDTDFAAGARELRSRTFVAHVRYASTGAHTYVNTHPFEQDGRLFAHNGAFEGLEVLDERLAALGVADLVHGETDSERMFALITAHARKSDGDLTAAITAAINWLAEHVPVYALNFVLTTPTELWALRYPDTNELHVLERTAGAQRLDSRTDRIHAQSDELDAAPFVVVASEAMDDDPDWRPITSGVLVHVSSDLQVSRAIVRSSPPAQPLTRADVG